MKDKYVFDSNIFINLHQRQPRDIYPSVWNKIDELMANGTIISSREVYDELTRSDDSLSEWAKSKRNISYHQKSLFKNESEKFYPNIEDSSRAAKNKTTQILL